MEFNKTASGLIPFISVFLVVFITAAVFLCRAPVIIVTDPSFNMIYGPSRAKTKNFELSIKYFRRIRQVTVSETANSEIITEAVKFASFIPVIKKPVIPKMVFFSGFFTSAAYKYSEEFSEIPVFVLEGRTVVPIHRTDDSIPVHIQTDLEVDLFKAGVCAGTFAENNGRVLIFQEITLAQHLRAAFEKGMESRGFGGTTIYLEKGAEYLQPVSCIVALTSSARFSEPNQKVPIILFSWLDPDMTPGYVKAVFDDSPWALAAGVLEKISREPDYRSQNGNTWKLPSELILITKRINEGNLLKKLLLTVHNR